MISKTDKSLKLVVLEDRETGNRTYQINELEDVYPKQRVLAYCEENEEALAVIWADGYTQFETLLYLSKNYYFANVLVQSVTQRLMNLVRNQPEVIEQAKKVYE
jgi:hypothetical protein